MRRRHHREPIQNLRPQQVVTLVATQAKLETEVLRYTGVLVAIMMLSVWLISGL